MTISRKPVRTHFASLLTTALVGAGLPAQAVYSYKVGDFGGQSSVVVVASGPIERRVGGLGNCWDAFITLDVYVFVLYADIDNGWTEEDAADAVDAIEAIIADVVVNNRFVAGYWGNAMYSEPTQPDVVPIGGVAYQRELIKIQMEVVQ